MPRKLRLGWQDGTGGRRGRWFARYKKRRYYFPGTNKSDMKSYRGALELWHKQRAELDSDLNKPHAWDYSEAIRYRERLARLYLLDGDTTRQKQTEKELGQLRKLFSMPEPPPLSVSIDPVSDVWPIGERINLIERLSALDAHEQWTGTPQKEKALGYQVARYLDTLKARSAAGEVSLSYLGHFSEILTKFSRFIGIEQSVDDLRPAVLSSWRDELLREVGAKNLSRTYANAILKKSLQFVRHLWSEEVMVSLPRNIGGLRIKIGNSSVPSMNKGELDALLGKVKTKRRLWVLLMLNCGFTQIDIANLRSDEVDWRDGIITRKRTKTRNASENTPTVRYRLWPETWELLKYYGKRDGLVLPSKTGKPLVYHRITTGGRVAKYDTLAKSFRKIGVVKIKRIRKTAASMLDGHGEYGRMPSIF
jgi:integrase